MNSEGKFSPITFSVKAHRKLLVLLVVSTVVMTSAIWLTLYSTGMIPGRLSDGTGAAGSVNDKDACDNEARPYSAKSPWNTPIPSGARTSESSQGFIDHLTKNAPTLTSDVDQYTISVYCVGNSAPRNSVELTGYYSDYTSGQRKSAGRAPTVRSLPFPEDVKPPRGTDGQVVVWDSDNGVEYGWWQFKNHGKHLKATNGYATELSSYGIFPDGLAGRGGGTTYLAGLVRPKELSSGNIEHALAFAYQYPSKDHVWPASKSDGLGQDNDLPEGTLLQLNPSLSEEDLSKMGVTPAGIPVARALQKYGMYTIDNSGSSKVYLEARNTAGWGPEIHQGILGKIPWSNFRVIEPLQPPPR